MFSPLSSKSPEPDRFPPIRHKRSNASTVVPPFTYHLPFIFASIAGVFFAGQWLKKNTKTKMPYLDAYTSIFSLTATWFMVNFAHENWLYWMAIDSVSIYLYYKRGLKLSTILYAFYFYLAIAGYFRFDLFF